MTDTKSPLTVYYDGACPLCSIEIAHYRRQTGSDKLRFVDASDPRCTLGDDLSREEALKRFHVRDPSGALISGAAGFARIWAVLPRWRWAVRVAALPGVTPLLEALYRGFLPIRPALSRLAGRLARR
jgi:predicted DCC family thiol-disulfide oxidoreductase YuxK